MTKAKQSAVTETAPEVTEAEAVKAAVAEVTKASEAEKPQTKVTIKRVDL